MDHVCSIDLHILNGGIPSCATSGKQPGDPVLAAFAIILTVAPANPPHNLLRGNNGSDAALGKLDELRTEFTAGEVVASSADFPKPKND
jgi:hypothetical protein